jgi:hypothetical protein
MDGGDAEPGLVGDGTAAIGKDAFGLRMRLILKGQHSLAAVVVAHDAGENHHGPRLWSADRKPDG